MGSTVVLFSGPQLSPDFRSDAFLDFVNYQLRLHTHSGRQLLNVGAQQLAVARPANPV